MSVKSKMKDAFDVLDGWDINSVDPCTWNMVGCSQEGFVISLYVSVLFWVCNLASPSTSSSNV